VRVSGAKEAALADPVPALSRPSVLLTKRARS